MVSKENYKAAKELVKRYNTITEEDIDAIAEDIEWEAIPQVLTGYGDYCTCTLCTTSKKGCTNCVYTYSNTHHCNEGETANTYRAIYFAENKRELLEGFKNRAIVLQDIISRVDETQLG